MLERSTNGKCGGVKSECNASIGACVVSSKRRGPNNMLLSGSQRHHTIDHVAIVVPARNEAATILRTLDAIDAARQRLPATVTSSRLIVLDDCTDETEHVLRQRLRRETGNSLRIVRCDARNVGAARALGTGAALDDARHRGAQLSTTWLATTDADTFVPPHWLHEQLRLANRGVDAVAGTVSLANNVDSRLRKRFEETYRLGHDGTHGHVHGANMSMRATTYLEAGGWHPLVCGEDHDLWGRLGQVGNCVSSTAIAVTTSDRLRGRAPEGFAADLAELQRAEPVA